MVEEMLAARSRRRFRCIIGSPGEAVLRALFVGEPDWPIRETTPPCSTQLSPQGCALQLELRPSPSPRERDSFHPSPPSGERAALRAETLASSDEARAEWVRGREALAVSRTSLQPASGFEATPEVRRRYRARLGRSSEELVSHRGHVIVKRVP